MKSPKVQSGESSHPESMENGTYMMEISETILLSVLMVPVSIGPLVDTVLELEVSPPLNVALAVFDITVSAA
jgi:hypothetical protein